MKIFLDTVNKIINLQDSVSLGDLVLSLDKILPTSTWERFSLQMDKNVPWIKPYVIKEYGPKYPYSTYPWYNPIPDMNYTQEGISGVQQLQQGTYCIEV